MHIPLTLEGCSEGARERRGRETERRRTLGCHFSYCITAVAAAAASLRLIMSHIQCSTTYECDGGAAAQAVCAVCTLLMA